MCVTLIGMCAKMCRVTHTQRRGRSWSTTAGNPCVSVMQPSHGECSGFNPAPRSVLPLPGTQRQHQACGAHLEVRLYADRAVVTQYNVI